MLVPDVEGRVWVIAEICANCAEAMPRVKVLSGGRPREQQPVAVAARPAAVDPPPTASPPARPDLSVPPPAKKTKTVEAKASEGDRARKCEICATEARPTTPPDAVQEQDPDQAQPVPARFGALAADTLRYLDCGQAGHSPEARLLALLLTLRMRRDGTFFMRSCELSALRMDLPPWALKELIVCGWADASFEEVCAAGPGDRNVECRIPELRDGLSHLGITPSVRSRVNAWALNVACHPSLMDRPAGIRLGAFYATAHCNATGHAAIYPRDMAKLCRYTSRDLALPALEALQKSRWLRQVQPGYRAGDPIKITLSQSARRFAPGATSLPTPTQPGPHPKPLAVRGRGHEIAAWVDSYVARHHHGPRNRELFAAHYEEDPRARWTDVMMAGALARLADDGWLLTDNNRWYRTRPGPTYLRRLLREQATDPPPQPTRHRQPSPLAADAEGQTLRGLWNIPGAEAVLGPCPQ
ncbi:hypothetical protein [Streptomyces kronopolitis]|uniref:hypothetical protein n=1 Tax=Streptomyces kronopolitis TaxID=1612435 RepID=UPI00166A8086|nr:hypothetical protein [Streptomyces kronopolitis]